jgi:hypothetical protein
MIRKNMIIEILVMLEIVKYLSFRFISFNYTFLKETKILLLIKYYSISMNHSVIIPEFLPYEKIRNFIPEVVKIQKGDNVKWINVSKDFHNLYFFGVLNDPLKVEIVEQLQIGPGESKELTFNYDYSQIDYICKEHAMKDLKEHSSISIFVQKYSDMSNTERLICLNKRFNIRYQYLLSQLDGRE